MKSTDQATGPFTEVMDATYLTPTSVRWRVVALSVVMAVLLYLDRYAMNAVQPAVMKSLGLSLAQFGWITSAFFWAYALAQVPAGLLGDRLGGRVTLSLYVTLWSLAFGAQAFATSFEMLVALRVLQGVAQAGGYAVTASFLKQWIEPKRRGVANSSVSMGGRMGGAFNSLGTPALVAGLGLLLFRLNFTDDPESMPWRSLFAAYASLGFLWSVVFYSWFRDTPEQHRHVNAAELAIIRADTGTKQVAAAAPPWWVVLKNRNLWLLSSLMFVVNVGYIFLPTTLPTYLNKVHGLTLVSAGFFTALTAAGGIAGCLSGGFATDYLLQRAGPVWGRRLPGIIACGGAATMYLVALLLGSAYSIALALMCVYFLNDFLLGALWSTVQDVGRRNAGSMFGFINMSGNLGAAAFTPVIGSLAEQKRWDLVFVASAGAFAIALALWFFVDPRIKLPETAEA